jgi:hypothetical protein
LILPTYPKRALAPNVLDCPNAEHPKRGVWREHAHAVYHCPTILQALLCHALLYWVRQCELSPPSSTPPNQSGLSSHIHTPRVARMRLW